MTYLVDLTTSTASTIRYYVGCTDSNLVISSPRRRKRNNPTQDQRRQWREDAFRKARCR